MSDEIKAIYLKGKTLTADVFAPNGDDRETSISLSENSTGGMYLGDCSTIQAGDTVIIYDGTTLVGGGEYKQLVSGVSAASAVEPAGYIGDYEEKEVITFPWHTNVASSTDGTIKVYKKDSNDEVTVPTGITDARDIDSKTGVHRCSINLAANTFYAIKRDYLVVLAGIIIDGVTVNVVIATFSIKNRYQGREWTKEG